MYFHITFVVSMISMSTACGSKRGSRYCITFSQPSSFIKNFEKAEESMTITILPHQLLCRSLWCGR
ncbi:65aa long hypothetical protein [Pyrococcus horikoshii OT3]|uniref:Uncharacterized protein n=1 Tax=Pyrococcus horikoshii (strain ATCC 700860 / DSM 12428 / JCM 9974 / NBRC 100139 / OT-3) TaxID=70601 RepID=O73962_PYRHO|nr:65aa long hypothetical protein [Pyrococcus horikoshii OT3]